MLNTPDRNHSGLQSHPGGGGQPASDQATGHSFHGDKAHPDLLALVHQLLFLGPGQVAVWELERGVQPGVNGLMGHGQPVIGDGDMADLALGLGLQGGIIQAILAAGLGAEGGVMELVNVNVVGAQVPQAGFQVLL